MNDWNKQVLEAIGRAGDVSRSRGTAGSRAAAVVGQECQMIIANNPNRSRSRAASVTTYVNKAKVIHDFIFSHGRII
jgi:hypothetical protein